MCFIEKSGSHDRDSHLYIHYMGVDKENVFENESDSEDEEKPMAALPDSDIDEIEDQLFKASLKYESEEYR